MTGTITWAFTHRVKLRNGSTITAVCGLSGTNLGWRDLGTYCPDCYPINTYPRSRS